MADNKVYKLYVKSLCVWEKVTHDLIPVDMPMIQEDPSDYTNNDIF